MKTIGKFLQLFSILIVTASLVTCSNNTPACVDEGNTNMAQPVSRASRFYSPEAAIDCPAGGGGGGGGNGACSSTLTPSEVLFGQASTGSITTLAISSSSPPLALMCTTATASTGQLAVANLSNDANYLYYAKTVTGSATINGFSIGHVAPVTLTPVSLSPMTITGTGFFSSTSNLQADPSGLFLTLTDTSESVVHVLLIDQGTGALTEAPGSPFSVPNALFATAAVNAAGEFLYVTDNVDGQIYIYSVNVSASPVMTQITNSPFSASGGVPANSPISMLVGSGANFLYTANSLSISIFAISTLDGSLMTAPGSNSPVPPPLAFSPQLLAMDSTGSFLYVSGMGTEGVAGYLITPGTGGLTTIGGSPFAASTTGFVSDIVADPTLSVLYIVINNVINPYTIATGAGGNLVAPTVAATFTTSSLNIVIAEVQ